MSIQSDHEHSQSDHKHSHSNVLTMNGHDTLQFDRVVGRNSKHLHAMKSGTCQNGLILLNIGGGYKWKNVTFV